MIGEISDFSTRYSKTLEKIGAFGCFMDFEKSSKDKMYCGKCGKKFSE